MSRQNVEEHTGFMQPALLGLKHASAEHIHTPLQQSARAEAGSLVNEEFRTLRARHPNIAPLAAIHRGHMDVVSADQQPVIAMPRLNYVPDSPARPAHGQIFNPKLTPSH